MPQASCRPHTSRNTWVEYGIGANFNLSKTAYTFVDLEKTAGSDVKENWKWTVGARIAF